MHLCARPAAEPGGEVKTEPAGELGRGIIPFPVLFFETLTDNNTIIVVKIDKKLKDA